MLILLDTQDLLWYRTKPATACRSTLHNSTPAWNTHTYIYVCVCLYNVCNIYVYKLIIAMIHSAHSNMLHIVRIGCTQKNTHTSVHEATNYLLKGRVWARSGAEQFISRLSSLPQQPVPPPPPDSHSSSHHMAVKPHPSKALIMIID